MVSIISGILNSTVGLLLNKVRDKTADKLKDGDITDAKIREIIVRELNDVKAKVDNLSRSFLHSSYCFLQEGVDVLKASLDNSEEKQKTVLSETHGDDTEASTIQSDVKSSILTEALTLSQAMAKVKIDSDKEFQTAKERFKDARKEATRAFYNEALSIKDRIFAAKIRIVSELLECLESPETAIAGCLSFLKKVHSLPAIREIFSVYINGGYKSIMNKAERAENVKSVMLINYVLFKFISEFSSKYCSAMSWPTIELVDRSFRPIVDWQEVSTRIFWGQEFIQPPNEVIPAEKIYSVVSAVNSRGEIIVRALDGNIIVIAGTGEVKMVKLIYAAPALEDGEVVQKYFKALAVNGNDNIYVLMYRRTRTESDVVSSYELYIFDENYNVKQNCTLHFLDVTLASYVEIAINKNNDIIVNMEFDPHVYVCDNAGELKHKFNQDASFLHTLTTSDRGEIMLPSRGRNAVHRYTEKDLKSVIVVPKGHEISSLAFHHAICKIMVLTFIRKSGSSSCFLLCYSETGELENSTFLWKTNEILYFPIIRSHPSGPVALLWREKITFI